MSLQLVEGFDHITTADPQSKGWSRNFAYNTGRFGTGQCWDCTNREAIKTLPGSFATLYVGAACKYRSTADGTVFFQLLDSGTVHMVAMYNWPTQEFRVYRGLNVTQLGSSYLKPLYIGQWYYIEFTATISDTVGVVELKIDGTSVIGPLTSQDTRNGANSTANQLRIGQDVNSNSPFDIDDLYVLDSGGSSPTNTYLGDIKVETLYPNGNGNSSVLLNDGGNTTNNYTHVDETFPNGDTDYVESSTVGDKDTYAYTNMATTAGTVFGVQINPYAKKTDAGTRSIKTVARVSTTEVDGPVQTLGASYAYLTDIRETKPGGGAWTISDVNGAEFGVKVNA